MLLEALDECVCFLLHGIHFFSEQFYYPGGLEITKLSDQLEISRNIRPSGYFIQYKTTGSFLSKRAPDSLQCQGDETSIDRSKALRDKELGGL